MTPTGPLPEPAPANEQEDFESKLTLESRSKDRAHTTEHAESSLIAEINVTPLVDVALVLVIIFMAVSPFMLQAGLKVTESKAGASTGKHSLDDNIQISLAENGDIFVNNTPVLLTDLSSKLKELLPKTKDKLVTLQAEKNNLVGQVVNILDTAKQSGAQSVALLNKLGEPSPTIKADGKKP